MSKRNKQPISIGTFRESTKSRRGLFRISGSNNREEKNQLKLHWIQENLLKPHKKRPHMPKMEELLNQISTEKTKIQKELIWI